MPEIKERAKKKGELQLGIGLDNWKVPHFRYRLEEIECPYPWHVAGQLFDPITIFVMFVPESSGGAHMKKAERIVKDCEQYAQTMKG